MNTLRTLVLVALATVLGPVAADEPVELSREQLVERFPGLSVDNIRESVVPGLYEVAVGAQVVYVSRDGRVLVRGDMIDLETDENLTDARQHRLRADMIAAVDEDRMVIFAPEQPRHTVTVFTDIDCSFCQRMHADIEEYKALGIAVRYMFYPRSGPGTESWAAADHVWCASDRRQALTRAKLGQEVEARECGETPVAMHHELGADVGLRGTPAIVSADGRMLGGYLAPQALLARLEEAGR